MIPANTIHGDARAKTMKCRGAWLREVRDAFLATEYLIGGLAFDTYTSISCIGVRRGVERCIEIVARQSRKLQRICLVAPSKVDWRLIERVGKALRQGRIPVDDADVWRIATVMFPEIDKLLETTGAPEAAE